MKKNNKSRIKNYIKEHKKFLIIVTVLLVIILASTLFLIISKKLDNPDIDMNNIKENTFTYIYKDEDGTTKSEITFETKPYNAIFKTSITPTDEETIDNEISYSYGQTNDKKYGNVLYLTKGNSIKLFKYKNSCIYDVTAPNIKYCTK